MIPPKQFQDQTSFNDDVLQPGCGCRLLSIERAVSTLLHVAVCSSGTVYVGQLVHRYTKKENIHERAISVRLRRRLHGYIYLWACCENADDEDEDPKFSELDNWLGHMFCE